MVQVLGAGHLFSSFEVLVGNAIEKAGFDVEYGIAVGEYRIDLAVTHQDYSDGYISEIECDEVPYFKLSKMGEDQKLLRERYLKDSGWDIYHILSTDWFEDPEGEATKLIDHLQEKIRDDELRWASDDESAQSQL